MAEDTTTEKEVELTEQATTILELMETVAEVNESFFHLIFPEEWKGWDIEDQLRLRKVLEMFFASASIMREKFDGDVWKGHADGTVNLLVNSIRKQREGDTPGRKKEELSPASLLAKRLNKK